MDENVEITAKMMGSAIRRIRKSKNLTLEQVSEVVGTDTGNLSRIERGLQGLRGETIALLAKAMGVREVDFFIEADPTAGKDARFGFPATMAHPGGNRLPIRRALFKLSAGVSGYEIEYENGESEPIFMARRWFEQNHYKPEKLIALKVNGRSMEPKMYDGDLAIVNTESTTPKDGVVFAVNYEGEMVIKRMKRDSGQWLLASDNPDKARFGDKVCTEACYLLGEVVYLQTETI